MENQEIPIPDDLPPLPDKWSNDSVVDQVRNKLFVAANSSTGEGRRIAALVEAVAILNDARAAVAASVAQLVADHATPSGVSALEHHSAHLIRNAIEAFDKSHRGGGCTFIMEGARDVAHHSRLVAQDLVEYTRLNDAELSEVRGQLAELRDDFIRYSGPHEIATWVDGDHAVCTCGAEWRYYGCDWLAEKTKTAAQLAQLREVDEAHQGVRWKVTTSGPQPAGVDIATHTLAIPFLAQDLDRLIAAAQIEGTDVVTFAAKAVLAAIFEVETGGGL